MIRSKAPTAAWHPAAADHRFDKTFADFLEKPLTLTALPDSPNGSVLRLLTQTPPLLSATISLILSPSLLTEFII
jgi:hypothetical protein